MVVQHDAKISIVQYSIVKQNFMLFFILYHIKLNSLKNAILLIIHMSFPTINKMTYFTYCV